MDLSWSAIKIGRENLVMKSGVSIGKIGIVKVSHEDLDNDDTSLRGDMPVLYTEKA